MPRGDEYRRHATECELRATQARDPSARQWFIEAAIQWRDMADHVDWMIGLLRPRDEEHFGGGNAEEAR